VAFDGAVHALFVGNFQHSCLGQQPDVPVHGGLGDVGQASAQVGGGPCAPAGHRVHDAQPDRVEEQVKSVHRLTFPHLVPFPQLG